MIALLALRMGIGFHFFREGAAKLQDPTWSSAGFFANAKGELAGLFHSMVWDADGSARMNLEQTTLEWGQFKERAARHFGFNEEQLKQADAAYQRHVAQLESHLADYARDIEEYQQGLKRRDAYLAEQGRAQVGSLREQIDTIDRELQAKRRELLAPIDRMWKNYEAELNALATPEQRGHRNLALAPTGRRFIDTKLLDRWVPYFDLTVGLLLLVGLFTRPAAIAGFAFLVMVMASQFPGSPGSLPVWPQFIEALGLLVVAATAPAMGSLAGLDYLRNLTCGWCCGVKQGAKS